MKGRANAGGSRFWMGRALGLRSGLVLAGLYSALLLSVLVAPLLAVTYDSGPHVLLFFFVLPLRFVDWMGPWGVLTVLPVAGAVGLLLATRWRTGFALITIVSVAALAYSAGFPVGTAYQPVTVLACVAVLAELVLVLARRRIDTLDSVVDNRGLADGRWIRLTLVALFAVGGVNAVAFHDGFVPPGSLNSATAETRDVLTDTARQVLPTHTYTLEGPGSPSCWGVGLAARDGWFGREWVLTVDLQPGDDPAEMEQRILDYWASNDERPFMRGAVKRGRWFSPSGHTYDPYVPGPSWPDELSITATTACYNDFERWSLWEAVEG